MKIQGLQKLTLLDFPGKTACTVFLGGCDFRCPFCHNSDILTMDAEALLDENELFEFLKKRKNLLEGVAITGGEPLLRRDIEVLLRGIKEMGYLVKLDTNGNHPDVLKRIVEEGLVDYVAMDIKNSPERYAETIGLEKFDLSKVEESKNFLLSGKVDYEFRTTTVKEFHDADSFKAIAKWIEGAQNYYLQTFVDRDKVMFAGLSAYSKEEMEGFEAIVKPFVKNTGIRG
ncbi:MAG: anaerobic ribonucleoside-triphosphate reductase activating protein [Erysipelotrichaceae bacterium]|nr:anaerobic ribonucleoside-triphosphate reductase activating protein [Erysipelotrichaceae bacterium]